MSRMNSNAKPFKPLDKLPDHMSDAVTSSTCSFNVLGSSPITVSGLEVIKHFILVSVEHEISNTHKYKDIKKFSFFFQARIRLKCYFSCI